jgi:hypothetical protein
MCFSAYGRSDGEQDGLLDNEINGQSFEFHKRKPLSVAQIKGEKSDTFILTSVVYILAI